MAEANEMKWDYRFLIHFFHRFGHLEFKGVTATVCLSTRGSSPPAQEPYESIPNANTADNIQDEEEGPQA